MDNDISDELVSRETEKESIIRREVASKFEEFIEDNVDIQFVKDKSDYKDDVIKKVECDHIDGELALLEERIWNPKCVNLVKECDERKTTLREIRKSVEDDSDDDSTLVSRRNGMKLD